MRARAAGFGCLARQTAPLVRGFRVSPPVRGLLRRVPQRDLTLGMFSGRCAADGTPQCFLLTPKLLPELPYSQHVTILQIMNGTAIGDVSRQPTNVGAGSPARVGSVGTPRRPNNHGVL
jgi:hypothetical protein